MKNGGPAGVRVVGEFPGDAIGNSPETPSHFLELVGKTDICAEVAEVAPGVVAFPNGYATKIRGQKCSCFPTKTRCFECLGVSRNCEMHPNH